MLLLFFVFLLSIALSVAFLIPQIWIFNTFRIGQNIRAEGPQAHLAKAGTPTMGGLAILFSILIVNIIFINLDMLLGFLALALLILCFGIIGFFDDLLKLLKKQNMGLNASDKFLLQVFFASIFIGLLAYFNQLTSLSSMANIICFNNLWIYIPFAVFIIVATANASNLSDGLDGLLSGMMVVIFIGFTIVAYQVQANEAALFALSCAGACLGFLKFNYHPAKIFMGDIGSLSLGAALAGLAIILRKEMFLLVIAMPLVLEALSVILQVFSFKLFKKRVFKMSPLHHHFELCGIKEKYVTWGFWMFTLIMLFVAVKYNV